MSRLSSIGYIKWASISGLNFNQAAAKKSFLLDRGAKQVLIVLSPYQALLIGLFTNQEGPLDLEKFLLTIKAEYKLKDYLEADHWATLQEGEAVIVLGTRRLFQLMEYLKSLEPGI